ncbi:MAG TPA: hypothetical protein VFX48_04285, partial [Saprospiraceae bacterium]|nr:hypothetical protein [Saprospiraceae bacterium]
CHLFYINVADLCDPDDNLDWPDCDKPFVIQNCSTIDSSLGPRIRSGACSQLFINYSDEVVPDVPGYCFQIRRNWEVIDWCQYNKNMIPNPGEWSFIQTLNVGDSLAPDLEIFGLDCSEADSTGLASVHIGALVNDLCTPEHFIFYSYFIDLDSDGMGKYGSHDLQSGRLSWKEYLSGIRSPDFDNPFASTRSPRSASGDYPVGRHLFVSEVTDGCGNSNRDSFYFEVIPSEPPQFECPVNDFFIPVHLPRTYELDIQRLVLFYEDNCTAYPDLRIYFDADRNKTRDLVSCEDFHEAGNPDTLSRNYQISVEDRGGNFRTCTITIHFLRLGSCSDSLRQSYTGQLTDRNGKFIERAKITVASLTENLLFKQEHCDHRFAFFGYSDPPGYELEIKKDDSLLNGIDVLDVYDLQSHLLGVHTITDPLTALIADVNFSRSLTAADVRQLENAILHKQRNQVLYSDDFWRFFKASDHSEITPFVRIQETDLLCLGYKMGDLSGDALSLCGEQPAPSNGCLRFQYPGIKFEAGQIYRIPISSADFNAVLGFQSGFFIQDTRLSLEGVELAQLNSGASLDASFELLGQNRFHLLYVSPFGAPLSFAPTDTLLYVILKATGAGESDRYLSTWNDPVKAMAYKESRLPLTICLEGLVISNQEESLFDFDLYPNPSIGDVNLSLPEMPFDFSIQLYDALGHRIHAAYFNGRPEGLLKLPAALFSSSGVYRIVIQMQDEIKTKTLVRMSGGE